MRPLTNLASLTSFEQAVGRTPLLRLKWASEVTGCNIFGKAEYCNPGGSIKDRAALWMIKDAEQRGELVRGQPGIVVEGTAGNTGIGLALAASCFGYDTIICIANTQSEEKKNTLRWAGAHLVEVPAVPFKDPNNYVHIADRLSKTLKAKGIRTLYANQWDNLSNSRSHTEGTGPEIYEQLEGRLDGFSCAVGTGGTLRGVADFLRQKMGDKVKIGLTDPRGAGLVRFYTEGVIKAEGSSISEGIGQNRITKNIEGFKPDVAIEVFDEQMMETLHQVQKRDGLMIGGSAAINVAGAMQFAQKLGKGSTVVTVLCDSGSRYATKLYNPQVLRSKGLQVPEWLDEEKSAKKYGAIGLQDAVNAAILK
jgi:cysteine synthase A